MNVEQRRYYSSDPGPEIYFGYCNQSQRFRMMGFEEYVDNMREGYQRMWRDADPWSRLRDRAPARRRDRPARHRESSCCCKHRSHDCHCECCVCDADVLVHARCGEKRRISLTFDNESRRERDVKLTLGAFSTSGGTDVGWKAQLSATEFQLRPCEEKTVLLDVEINCAKLLPGGPPAAGDDQQRRTVDRCVVAYATVRAEGCLSRPIVVAVAVLPDDCDSYGASCGCHCCC